MNLKESKWKYMGVIGGKKEKLKMILFYYNIKNKIIKNK